MTEGEEREQTTRSESKFSSCPKCGMRVLTTELSIHLAHAHNYAPSRKTDRKPRRPRD